MSKANTPGTPASTTDLMPFSYQGAELRTVLIDGEPWFVAPDACRMLDLRDTSSALRMVDEDDKQSLRRSDTPHFFAGIAPQVQMLTIVNEAGMWALIFQSNKDQARQVRYWITHDVLPAIRKTGSYSTVATLPDRKALAQMVIEAEEARELAEARNVQLTAKVEADAPKVSYVDTFVADGDLQKFRTVAAALGMRESALRNLLVAKRWIYVEQSTRWSDSRKQYEKIQRYSAHAEKRHYFKAVKRHEAPLFKGEVMHTLKVTPAGAEAIARLVKRAQNAA